jgi:hypothetical protein
VGRDNPFYVLQFDKRGEPQNPETLEQVNEVMRTEPFADIFVFSHGWNNDWLTADRRYGDFIDGFVGQLSDDRTSRSLLLGVFWPSALLVMPGEEAPRMAASDGEIQDPDAAALEDVTAELDPEAALRVQELVGSDESNEDRAQELVRLLLPLYGTGIDELGEEAGEPEPAALVASWQAGAPVLALPEDEDREEMGWGTADDVEVAPTAAGGWDGLDLRAVIRGASVWVMKDRAGRVGATAVAGLLRDALVETDAKVHLVGHSFGGKVVLSAICAQPLSRLVHSVLLLQPAVNHLCFAGVVPGRRGPGGYRPALERVERPILSTYSAHDAPLTRFFHWALRRRADLGEPLIAAWPEPPSDYAALGGYGPHGADAATQRVTMKPPGLPYALDPDRPLAAVDATAAISGHSAISNPSTWWALHELVS